MGMPACCWGHLAGISGGEKIYLGIIVITINFAALCAAIGGQDGVDGNGGHWMSFSINRIHQYIQKNHYLL